MITDLSDQSIGYLYTGEQLIGRGLAAHVVPLCATCCGYVAASISPDPITALVGSTVDLSAYGEDCTGAQILQGGAYGWKSSNTSVATMSNYAMKGVGAGRATISCTVRLRANEGLCPAVPFNPASPATVQCIPTLSAPIQCPTCDGTTVSTAPLSIDGFDYSHITKEVITATTDNVIVIQFVGQPFLDKTLCPPQQDCWKQKFIGHPYPTNPDGNINWRVTIYCDGHATPDLVTMVPQRINCVQ